MDASQPVLPLDPAPRRFRLVDAIVLIVLLALGCWLTDGFRVGDPGVRMYASTLKWVFHSNMTPWLIANFVIQMIARLLWPFQLFLGTLTIGLALLRWTEPRPEESPTTRPTLHPGSVACLVVAIVLAAEFGLLFGYEVIVKLVEPLTKETFIKTVNKVLSMNAFVIMAAPMAGWSVVAVWITMRLTGARRQTKDWIDRAGCIVSLGWVLPLPLYAQSVLERLPA